MTGGLTNADESDALVQLDKEWGAADAAEVIAPLIADGILTIGPEGLVDKTQMLEAVEDADASTGPYVAGDYDVRFLSDDVAVMVHSAGDPDPHWSMHVWQKRDGKWQVAASATVPTSNITMPGQDTWISEIRRAMNLCVSEYQDGNATDEQLMRTYPNRNQAVSELRKQISDFNALDSQVQADTREFLGDAEYPRVLECIVNAL